jgi:phage terminase large subunit GpA-like protein
VASFEERVRAVLLEAAKAAAPPPDLTVCQWAENTRVLGHSSRLSGPYRVSHTPYWREPMDALSPRSGVQQVVLMKGAQIGATEFLLNVLGFHLDIAPSPILAVQPTIEMARRFSRQRLAEMLDLAPGLQKLTAVPRGGKLPSSELFKATTSGAVLVLAGANSPTALRSLPARIILLDEVDGYPGDVGGEGDPCDLAIQRAETYGSAKRVLLISTPTEKGLSRIERLYQATDQRKYFVQCPHCAGAITLEFEQLRVERTAIGKAIEEELGNRKPGPKSSAIAEQLPRGNTVDLAAKRAGFKSAEPVHICQLCGASIRERDKLGMVETGEWRATAACEPDKRGYHLSQLYSPWTSWGDLLRRAEAAKGIPEKERVFYNTALGASWSPPALEVPEAEALIARAEPYPEGTVPKGAAFLTAGVDVQADRLECEIVAWGRDFESWSVAYHVLHGDIAEPTVWEALHQVLSRAWPHASGMPLTLQAACIDAGFRPAEVTQFTRHRHGQRVYATKGISNGWGRPIWPRRASFDKNKHAVYLVSADEAKAWVANRMRIAEPGAGFLHTPLSRPRDWYEQLTAERLVFQKNQRRWLNPQRARNEAFDCRALAVCALHSRLLAGLDLNGWCESFEAMIAPAPTMPMGAAPSRPNGPLPQISRSKWMSF